jgi:hypothetical protein|nr:hypothetical protein [Kofleriaceae bacterium]
MRRWLLVVALAACSKSSHSEGLPPATDWSSNSVTPNVQLDEPPADDNPHAGVDMTGDSPGPVDPSQQLPPNHPSMTGQVPEGAASSGPGGLPPPDPNRAIDPTHRVAGVIKVDPRLAAKVTDATPMFIYVKRRGADGNPTGFPIASQRVVWTPGKDYAFTLTDQDIMTGVSDKLVGDVVVFAHVDHDGDALTKTSNDLLGQVAATLPADGLTLTLDQAIP